MSTKQNYYHYFYHFHKIFIFLKKSKSNVEILNYLDDNVNFEKYEKFKYSKNYINMFFIFTVLILQSRPINNYC